MKPSVNAPDRMTRIVRMDRGYRVHPRPVITATLRDVKKCHAPASPVTKR